MKLPSLSTFLFASLLLATGAQAQDFHLVESISFNDRLGEISVPDCMVVKGGVCSLRPQGLQTVAGDQSAPDNGFSGPIYIGALNVPSPFAIPVIDSPTTAKFEAVGLSFAKIVEYRNSGVPIDLVVTFTGNVSTGDHSRYICMDPFCMGKEKTREGWMLIRLQCADSGFLGNTSQTVSLHVPNLWQEIQTSIRLFNVNFAECTGDLKMQFQMQAPKMQFLDARLEIHPS